MGYGGGSHAPIANKNKRTKNRNAEHRSAKRQIKANNGVKVGLQPQGSDKKKLQQRARRLRNIKLAPDVKKPKNQLPVQVSEGDIKMLVEEAST